MGGGKVQDFAKVKESLFALCFLGLATVYSQTPGQICLYLPQAAGSAFAKLCFYSNILLIGEKLQKSIYNRDFPKAV